MSLEKLLLFGFAIAVVAALVLSGQGITDSREVQDTGYRDQVSDLAEKAK